MLKNIQGKKVVLELVNGKTITGEVLAADQQFIRVSSEWGIGTLNVDAVQIIWEPSQRSITQENMDHIAKQMRDEIKLNLVCYPNPFSCPGTYGCAPPHFCFPNFSCGPAGFSQAGGPPGCTTGYQCLGSFFGIQCQPPGFTPMSGPGCGGSYAASSSGEPASGQTFCTPFQFRPICGPFQFNQVCVPFPFGAPCGPFQFGACGSFQFGGSQCGVPGGFVCGGAQFIGAPIKPPGMVSTEDVKEDDSKKSKKE